MSSCLVLFLAVASQVRFSTPLPHSANSSRINLTTAHTSLTLLYQNNLNSTDDVNRIGAILLDPMSHDKGEAACAAVGETLLPTQALQNHSTDFIHSLSYLRYSGAAKPGQQYWIENGVASLDSNNNDISFATGNITYEVQNPILCSQSSTENGPDAKVKTESEILIKAGRTKYKGFRNLKSFRFQGIPYADRPERFQYSTTYSQVGQTIDATEYGANCAQARAGVNSEDCLFLNIQTPYLPRTHSSENRLRPVLFSIHGGGFTGGNGGMTSGQDGGNLASREDIVSVQINYRLGSLGFLAVPGTDIRGNFGIGDQITALRWVKENIAAFGGDPDRITIIGESAGAGSVRALLGSPLIIKENLIAGAIAQSNLGGGVSLGLVGNYGTTFSSYLTINESYTQAGIEVFEQVSCSEGTVFEQISCLKNIPFEQIVNGTAAYYVVQDGEIIDTEQLIVSRKNGSAAEVPVIFGVTVNDGASIGSTYPKQPVSSELEGLRRSLGIHAGYAQAIIDSGLFPLYDTGNITLDSFNISQRIATNITFRCIDQATVFAASQSKTFPASYYFEMERTFQGFDPNNLGANLSAGPVEPGYPFGNPSKPYFRLHGSDLGFTYGNQEPLRDATDLQASQVISAYFAQFAKTGDPNPEGEYLKVRGFDQVLRAVEEGGEWQPVSSGKGPAKALDDVSRTIEFPELEQCTWLNYTLSYYLDGGG